MYVKQVINNNVIVSLDEKDKDIIVVAKGIGWKCKSNIIIDENKYPDYKIYILDNPEIKTIQDVYERIPQDLFELSNELMQNMAKDREIGFIALLMLADHINETIERLKKGLYLNNKLTNEIKIFYSKEFGVASKAAEYIGQNYALTLNDDEIAFIATHLINLNLNNMGDSIRSIEIVDEIVNVIRRYLKIELKINTYQYSRFITHLKYFSTRVIKREPVSVEYDSKLSQFVRDNYSKAYKCSELIKKYIIHKYGYDVSKAEIIYLAIHLQNLM